jgi:ribose transport system ATP-binding protein
MRRAAAEALRPFGMENTAGREIRTLGVAERQLVEIARATATEARVLILDEPTSSLNPTEVELFFEHVRRIRDGGTAVILITHRIDEIIETADRVSALRDGRLVHTGPIEDLDAAAIVALIAGRPLEEAAPRRVAEVHAPLLEAHVPHSDGRSWELSVGAGEIVGVAGLLGSGAQELIGALSGQVVHPDERVSLGDVDLSGAPLARRVTAGLCLLPGDHARSLALHLPVEDNVLLPNLARFRSGPVVARARLRDTVRRLVAELGVRPADPRARVAALSGGNKQKVAIAKWLASNARVILMDDPFRGVDVGARHEIAGVIDEFVRGGGGVVFYSSDTRELTALADRVVVMRAGDVVSEFSSPPFDGEAIMASATGASMAVGSGTGR